MGPKNCNGDMWQGAVSHLCFCLMRLCLPHLKAQKMEKPVFYVPYTPHPLNAFRSTGKVRPMWGSITSSNYGRKEGLHTFAIRKGRMVRKPQCPAQLCGGHRGAGRKALGVAAWPTGQCKRAPNMLGHKERRHIQPELSLGIN